MLVLGPSGTGSDNLARVATGDTFLEYDVAGGQQGHLDLGLLDRPCVEQSIDSPLTIHKMA